MKCQRSKTGQLDRQICQPGPRPAATKNERQDQQRVSGQHATVRRKQLQSIPSQYRLTSEQTASYLFFIAGRKIPPPGKAEGGTG